MLVKTLTHPFSLHYAMTGVHFGVYRCCRVTASVRRTTPSLSFVRHAALLMQDSGFTTCAHSSALGITHAQVTHCDRAAADTVTYDENMCELHIVNRLAQQLHLPQRFMWDTTGLSSSSPQHSSIKREQERPASVEQFTWTPTLHSADGRIVPLASQHTTSHMDSSRTANPFATLPASSAPASSLSTKALNRDCGGGGGVLHRSRLEAYLALLHTASVQALTAAASPPTSFNNNSASKGLIVAPALSWRPSQDELYRLRGRLVLYCGDQVDPLLLSAAKVMQLGHVRVLQSTPQPISNVNNDANSSNIRDDTAWGGFTMSQLRAAMQEDIAAGRLPCMVVGVFGSAYSGAVDPLVPCATLCARMRVWFHVDASYGGLSLLAVSQVPSTSGIAEDDGKLHEERTLSCNADSYHSRSATNHSQTLQLVNLNTFGKNSTDSNTSEAASTASAITTTTHDPWRQCATAFYTAATRADSILFSCTADAFADVRPSLLSQLTHSTNALDTVSSNVGEMAALYVASVRKLAYVQHQFTHHDSMSESGAYAVTEMSGSSLSGYRCDLSTNTNNAAKEQNNSSVPRLLEALRWPTHAALPCATSSLLRQNDASQPEAINQVDNTTPTTSDGITSNLAFEVRYRQCVMAEVMRALRGDGRFDTDASTRVCPGFNLVLFRFRMLSDTATEALARHCQRLVDSQRCDTEGAARENLLSANTIRPNTSGKEYLSDCSTRHSAIRVTFALHMIQKRMWVAMRTLGPAHVSQCTTQTVAQDVQAILQLIRRAAQEVSEGGAQ